MQLKEQKYVVTLADTGNLTKAAGILGISQPALSLYIKNLEIELGQDLFTRENRRLKPTFFGEMYIEKARKILKIGEDFKDEMNTIKNGSKGRVVLGLAPWKTSIIVPKLLPQFKETYPDIDLEIIEDTEENLHEYLKQSKVDFYIGSSSVEGSRFELLWKDKIYVVASKERNLSSKSVKGNKGYPVLRINDFVDENFIMINSDIKSKTLPFNLGESKSFNPTRITKINSMDDALLIVKQGYGITLIPEILLKNSNLDGLEIFEVDSRDFTMDNGIVSQTKIKHNHFSLILSEMIKNNFQKK